MLELRRSTKLLLALCSPLAFGSCVGFEEGEPLDELTAETAELAAATTSACVTRPNGTSVRVDGAILATGTSRARAPYIVVPSGAVHIATELDGQIIFVERGGRANVSWAKNLIFVAAGGVADDSFNEPGRFWVKAGATMHCGFRPPRPTLLASGMTVHHEPGATLTNCSGATLIKEPVVSTFRRCTPTTPATQVQPNLAAAVTRTGRTLTVTNKTTGTRTPTTWRVRVSNATTSESKLLHTSTTTAGFEFLLPADFDTLYPEAKFWHRTVEMTLVDPFGVTRYEYTDF